MAQGIAQSNKEPALSRTAAELLQLEAAYWKRGHTEQQDQRWSELVVQLIELLRTDGDNRGWLRYDGDAQLQISKGGITRTVRVVDVSRGGLRVHGDLTRHIRKGDEIELVKTVGGVEHRLDVRGRVVRKRGRWQSAIALCDHRSAAVRRFFARLYYPTYVRFLKQLATN